jgi:tight adherence protein C
MTRYLLLGSGTLLCAVMVSGILLLNDLRRDDAMAARVRAIHGERPEAQPLVNQTEAVRGILTNLASAVGTALLRSGLIPVGTRSELELMLTSSGLRGSQGLNVFLGCKIFSPILMVLIGLFITTNSEFLHNFNLMVLPIFGVIGLLLPDWILGRRRTTYLRRVEQGLPDALDLMVICTQAGLGLGPSVVRVAEELQHSYRDLAMEFGQTASELQIMTDSRQALLNLGNRVGVESFKRFTATMVQTLQYGTPISEALRALSSELRDEMLTKFEERAARLPVMITGPMIVFILPCVFIIAAGPSVMQVAKVFAQ